VAHINKMGWNDFSISSSNKMGRKALFVELNSEFCFCFFPSQVRNQSSENLNSLYCSNLSHEQISMFFGILEVSSPIMVKSQSEKITHSFDGTRICHFNAKRKDVTGLSIGIGNVSMFPMVDVSMASSLGSLNGNTTFPINESGEIREFGFVCHANHGITKQYQSQGLHKKNSANSVDLLPGKAGDNTEPSISLMERACVESIYGTRKG
jgi:hypothetical protein